MQWKGTVVRSSDGVASNGSIPADVVVDSFEVQVHVGCMPLEFNLPPAVVDGDMMHDAVPPTVEVKGTLTVEDYSSLLGGE